MADLISAVRTYILAQTSVATLIGQRMYFDERPQRSTLPLATIHKSSETHVHTLSDRAGAVRTRIQIECFASTRLAANALAEAIYKCGIAAVKGVTNSVNIRGVMVEDGQRNYLVYDSEASDDHTYVTQFDLMVTYLE